MLKGIGGQLINRMISEIIFQRATLVNIPYQITPYLLAKRIK